MLCLILLTQTGSTGVGTTPLHFPQDSCPLQTLPDTKLLLLGASCLTAWPTPFHCPHHQSSWCPTQQRPMPPGHCWCHGPISERVQKRGLSILLLRLLIIMNFHVDVINMVTNNDLMDDELPLDVVSTTTTTNELSWIPSYSSHQSYIRQLLLSPFYWWAKWNLEKFSDLFILQVTEQRFGSNWVWLQSGVVSYHSSLKNGLMSWGKIKTNKRNTYFLSPVGKVGIQSWWTEACSLFTISGIVFQE